MLPGAKRVREGTSHVTEDGLSIFKSIPEGCLRGRAMNQFTSPNGGEKAHVTGEEP